MILKITGHLLFKSNDHLHYIHQEYFHHVLVQISSLFLTRPSAAYEYSNKTNLPPFLCSFLYSRRRALFYLLNHTCFDKSNFQNSAVVISMLKIGKLMGAGLAGF